ncbi:MAG: ATP-dependent zinc metalloprotease FtsH [Thermoguttaceae bacterium]
MSDEGQEPNSSRRDRNASGPNRNLIWYLLATGVIALFLMSVLEGNGQVELRYMDLVKLIEQGEPANHPKAAIDVRESIAGKDETVRYSKLDKIKIGPHEITGTVARQVVSPGAEFGKLEPNVEFHTPRVGLENDNNDLFNLLKKNGFQDVSAERAPSGWKSLMPMFLLTAMLIVIFFIMMRRLGGAGSAMAFGRSRGKLIAQEDVGVTYNDVAGIDEAVDELREVVDFLRTPEKYQVLGGRIPKGVLLVGPPGTGKTLLAKAIAGEAGVPFFSLSGSDFVEMFVGVGAARVRDMFQQAQTKAPCIVFIDELDALGKTRGSSVVGGHDEREQTLNALLVEMDGFSSNSGVIVMAATNRPETLDPALLRPGRFDRHVSVDRPDVKGREQILKVHIGKVKLDESVNLKEIARITPGFVGADLANLVNEAALLAARRNKKAVTMLEFNEGVERVVAGLEKRQRVMNPEEKQRTAYHESGHALVAYSLPNADPVHKVSIIPRGPTALGYTMFRPEGDRYTTTQLELESRIQSLLAGTVAEEMIFSDVATGAQNDLERATEIARSMVMEFGMSRLGRINFRERSRSLYLAVGDDLNGRNYSEQTAREIDLEIKRILEESLEKVRHVLATRRKALVALAERLVEKESIDTVELRTIIEENSPSAILSPGTAEAVSRRKDDEPPASVNLKTVEGGS